MKLLVIVEIPDDFGCSDCNYLNTSHPPNYADTCNLFNERIGSYERCTKCKIAENEFKLIRETLKMQYD